MFHESRGSAAPLSDSDVDNSCLSGLWVVGLVHTDGARNPDQSPAVGWEREANAESQLARVRLKNREIETRPL